MFVLRACHSCGCISISPFQSKRSLAVSAETQCPEVFIHHLHRAEVVLQRSPAGAEHQYPAAATGATVLFPAPSSLYVGISLLTSNFVIEACGLLL